ncbi:MAG: hypothetical protein NT027_14495 [Proteobacteria bacterium]|nr:hypothetical protein [Pseudomonadota bacterium]
MMQFSRNMPSERGYQWYVKGFDLFKLTPLAFGILHLTYWVLGLLLAKVPMGWAVGLILAVIYSFGYWNLASHLSITNVFDWKKIFAPFPDKIGKIFLFTVIAVIPVAIGLMGSGAYLSYLLYKAVAAGIISNTDLTDVNFDAAKFMTLMNQFSTIEMIPAVVVFICCALATGAMYAFGSPLIILTNSTPMEAANLSFKACVNNFGAVFRAMVIQLVLLIITNVTFGWAGIIAAPLMILANHVAFTEMFPIVDETAVANQDFIPSSQSDLPPS